MKTLNRKKKTDKVIERSANPPGLDAVKMMRDIRNKISSETQEMSYDQLIKYISRKVKKSVKIITDQRHQRSITNEK